MNFTHTCLYEPCQEILVEPHCIHCVVFMSKVLVQPRKSSDVTENLSNGT